MRTIAILSLVCGLAACTTARTASNIAAVNTTLASAQADVAKLVQDYGIVKGIALVAETADPTLAPRIATAIAVLDPAVATLQAVSGMAGADAPAIEAQVQTVQSQVTTLELTAAPAVKAVGG